MHIRVALKEY